MSDPLLDPPAGAPSWLPTIDDEERIRHFAWIIALVFVVGVGACVVSSGDNPADPVLTTPASSACQSSALLPAEFQAMQTRIVTVEGPDGSAIDRCVLVADDAEGRERGLMDVRDFSSFDGMLFVFTEDVDSPFYMFQTPTPLTITWWRADGSYVNGAVMDPCLDQPSDACLRYAAAGPYRFALELPTGGYTGVSLDAGSRLIVG